MKEPVLYGDMLPPGHPDTVDPDADPGPDTEGC